jgi:predicted dehydrogenase
MTSVSRRAFLGASAMALSTARSYSQIKGANDRLNIGAIGAGIQGSSHLRALVKNKEVDNMQVMAVCDIYKRRLDRAVELTGGKPYKNYHDLLANKDIDYVLIATPEHWHYQMTLDALAAGKHLYCEKPMTHTVEQARRVVAKVKSSNLKMQVGVQGMSDDSYITAHKYIQEGTLGKIVLAQIDYSRNHKDDFWAYDIDADARPGEDLDWNAFLGSAPKRPWDPDRFFRWRRYWDYSGGIATDLFVHRVTRIIKSIGLTFPEYGTATGGKFQFKESLAEIPDTQNILLDYPEGLTVQLISSLANDRPVDHLIRGHRATLEFNKTGFNIVPQKLFTDEVKAVSYEKHGAEDLGLHHRNLMNAIRKGEELNCDCNLGYYGVVAVGMGNGSYRKRKYMKWDKTKERIIPA